MENSVLPEPSTYLLLMVARASAKNLESDVAAWWMGADWRPSSSKRDELRFRKTMK